MKKYDAVIVGAGHNGLVAAAYLAKAGRKVLVIERRRFVGGAAVTEAFPDAPGFKFSACAEGAGRLHPQIVTDLQLQRHGLETLPVDPVTVSVLPDGSALPIWQDPGRTAREIARFSKADAARYPEFIGFIDKMGAAMTALITMTPPSLPKPERGDWLPLVKFGLKARRLGKKDFSNFLRIISMSARDMLAEWFESDVVRGALAASAVKNITLGPIEIGTSFWFLYRSIGSRNGCFRPSGFVKGGMGVLTGAMAAAARQIGVEIRTGSEVAEIMVKNGRATGVVLGDGQKFEATVVVSNADPRSTFFKLLDSAHLDPFFMRGVRSIKSRGSVARIHLALSDLPRLRSPISGMNGNNVGHFQISPDIDYLERAYDAAKYGGFARKPYLEVSIPTLMDQSLAPAGKHVMSINMQYAAYLLRKSDWDEQRSSLGETVLETLVEVMPNIRDVIEHMQVLTPLDLERAYGLTEGNPNHGEMTLDQFFYMRPVPGWARYKTPIKNMFLCGAGAHPGGGVTGIPGMKAAQAIQSSLRD